jgi:hypothetical protein
MQDFDTAILQYFDIAMLRYRLFSITSRAETKRKQGITASEWVKAFRLLTVLQYFDTLVLQNFS